MKLTDQKVRGFQPRNKPYKVSDGAGLHIIINPNGSKLWRLKFRFDRKERSLSLGRYPEVSLKVARTLRDEAKADLRAGIDPVEKRRSHSSASSNDRSECFKDVAEAWYLEYRIGRAAEYTSKVIGRLENYVYPTLGNMHLKAITSKHVHDLMSEINLKLGFRETASRIKGTISQVFRYAIALGYAETDPTVPLKGLLPSAEVNHYPAITDPVKLGQCLVRIENSGSGLVVSTALKLMPHMMMRPGELRKLKWSEVDWEKRRLETKALKGGNLHIVPLSDFCLNELKFLAGYTQTRSEFIFPSQRSAKRPMSENALTGALRAAGVMKSDAVPHGFRATARTLLDELFGFPVAWIELQLAHCVRDIHGRAYNRTTHLEGRRDMMNAWSEYLVKLKIATETGEPLPRVVSRVQAPEIAFS